MPKKRNAYILCLPVNANMKQVHINVVLKNGTPQKTIDEIVERYRAAQLPGSGEIGIIGYSLLVRPCNAHKVIGALTRRYGGYLEGVPYVPGERTVG